MRRIGINMHSIGGISDLEYARAAKALGFGATFSEVCNTLEEQSALADMISSSGLIYETLHAPFWHINDIWRDSEAGERMISELLFSVDACRAAGVPILVVHLSSGHKPPSITDIGRARFETLVEYAAHKGVTIAFENQRKLANISWAFENFEGCDNVGFCWDCGHEGCFTLGREYMPLFGDKLVCTHIHDNSMEFDADQHLIPFDGKIDYTRVAEHIRRSGYTGSLMLEVMVSNSNRYDGVSVEAYMERAAAAAKRLLNMVDTK